MTGFDEERIGELLRALPAPPAGWVQAAQDLPLARRGIDELVGRAERDAELRARLLADLEGALEAEGYELDLAVVETLRTRLHER